MGISGQFSAVTIPKWLIGVAGLVVLLLGTGATVGIRYAIGEARVTRLEVNHLQLQLRVDTIAFRLDSIVLGGIEQGRLLRSLAALRCLDGTPRTLLQAADLPCDRLVRR
jgi:hypothetical protein